MRPGGRTVRPVARPPRAGPLSRKEMGDQGGGKEAKGEQGGWEDAGLHTTLMGAVEEEEQS